MRWLVALAVFYASACERHADPVALSPYLSREAFIGSVPSLMGAALNRAWSVRDSTGCWPTSEADFGFTHSGVRVTGYSTRGDSLRISYAVDTLDTNGSVDVWQASYQLVRVVGGRGSVTAYPIGKPGPIERDREQGGEFILSDGQSVEYGDEEVVSTPRGHWTGDESLLGLRPSANC